jgi:transposase, IS5 family
MRVSAGGVKIFTFAGFEADLSWGMTRRRQSQKTLWEGVVAEDVRELWEPWMVAADKLLEDEELIERVYDAQGERHEHSRTRGRGQTAAEIVLRLLLLKHVRNWSYDVLEREVRANLAYRDFARIGLNKVPDAKTLARIGQALDGDVIAEMHRRLVELAREKGAVRGRKMRVDTTSTGFSNQDKSPMHSLTMHLSYNSAAAGKQ